MHAAHGMQMHALAEAAPAAIRAVAPAKSAGHAYPQTAPVRSVAPVSSLSRRSAPVACPSAPPAWSTVTHLHSSALYAARHAPATALAPMLVPDALDALNGGPHLPNTLVSALFSSSATQRVPCGLGCDALIETSRSALRDHAEAHGRRPERQEDGAQCGWRGCTQVVQWSGFARHLASHLGTMGGLCGLCAGSIGRADMAGRHIRACWGRMSREERVRRLEALGLGRGISEMEERVMKRIRLR
jgi:hypothetical protein